MDTALRELLTKKELTKKDSMFFVRNPYYRNIEGNLASNFKDLKSLWTKARADKDFTWMDSSEHRKYYRFAMEDGRILYGKLSLENTKIAYIYESLVEEDKKRYFCSISYDGTLFEGYQKQIDKRTVQGEIEEALGMIFQEDVKVYASGRTDKGVHAYQQTLHFDVDSKIPIERMKMIINQYLPEDIYCQDIEEKPMIFHARYDTLSKTYMYHLDFGPYDVTKRNYRWYVNVFDVDKFTQALKSVIGTYDFSSFTKTTDKKTVRTMIDIDVQRTGTEVKVFLTGNGFLRYMVRNLIMAAYLIAGGEVTYSMKELLDAKDNTILRQMAKPSGLYLYKVQYE